MSYDPYVSLMDDALPEVRAIDCETGQPLPGHGKIPVPSPPDPTFVAVRYADGRCVWEHVLTIQEKERLETRIAELTASLKALEAKDMS